MSRKGWGRRKRIHAFNTVSSCALRSEAHRAVTKVAVPLAADDQAALKIAIRLGEDAGFEPVVVGPLARAKEFDTGTPVFGKALTATELRRGPGSHTFTSPSYQRGSGIPRGDGGETR